MKIEDVWQDWKTEKRIGRGSFGTVYKCYKEEENGERTWAAIKVISVPGDDVELKNSAYLERMSEEQSKAYYREIIDGFLREIDILESLKGHPNIVRIDDSKIVEDPDHIGWHLFIRMELLTDFNTYSCDRAFSEQDVLKLASDLTAALTACAEKNIVHRDIKPENIFVDENGTFKLGDFGVAKQLERTLTAMSRKGTPNYMAPEVLNAQKGDSRADIYSLGIVMYQLLNNNRFPFTDPNKQFITHSEREKAFRRRTQDGEKIPELPNVSAGMNTVILKATQFRQEDRFRSIHEFAEALDLLSGKKKSVKLRSLRWSKGKKAAIALTAILLLLVLSVACFATFFPDEMFRTFPFLAKSLSDREISFLLGTDTAYEIENTGLVQGVCTFNGVDYYIGATDGSESNRLFKQQTGKEPALLSGEDEACTTQFSILKDKIYYTVCSTDENGKKQYSLCRVDPDGKKRETLFLLNGAGYAVFVMNEPVASYSKRLHGLKKDDLSASLTDSEVFFVTDELPQQKGAFGLFRYTKTDAGTQVSVVSSLGGQNTLSVGDVAFAKASIVFNTVSKKQNLGTDTYQYPVLTKLGELNGGEPQRLHDADVVYSKNERHLSSVGDTLLAFVDEGFCSIDPDSGKANMIKADVSGALLGKLDSTKIGVKLLSAEGTAVGYRIYDAETQKLSKSFLSDDLKSKLRAPAQFVSTKRLYLLNAFKGLGNQSEFSYELVRKEHGKAPSRLDPSLLSLPSETDFESVPVYFGANVVLAPESTKATALTALVIHAFDAQNDESWNEESADPLQKVSFLPVPEPSFVFNKGSTRSVVLRRDPNSSSNGYQRLNNATAVNRLSELVDGCYICEWVDGDESWRGYIHSEYVKPGVYGEGDGYRYTFNNQGKVELTQFTKDSASVTLPFETPIGKVQVVSSEAFRYNSRIESLTINDAVELSANAFENCSRLKSVSITGGKADVKYQCFHNCTALERLTLSSSAAIRLANEAFSGCDKLKKIDPAPEDWPTDWKSNRDAFNGSGLEDDIALAFAPPSTDPPTEPTTKKEKKKLNEDAEPTSEALLEETTTTASETQP